MKDFEEAIRSVATHDIVGNHGTILSGFESHRECGLLTSACDIFTSRVIISVIEAITYDVGLTNEQKDKQKREAENTARAMFMTMFEFGILVGREMYTTDSTETVQ